MDTGSGLIYLTATVVMFASPVTLAPMPDQYYRGVDWLSRYGYLSPPDPHAGKLQTKEGIEKAIRQMQRFAGLTETGELDADTLNLMSKPRCSLPDIVGTEDMLRKRKKRYALSGLRWGKKGLTWSLLNYPKLQSTLDPSLVKYLMYQALKVWSDNTNLQFSETGQANQADIKISFAHSIHDDGYPFDGKGGTLAHAFFPGDVDIAGDTHFDDEESWTYRDDRGTDLFTVAVHEFGHALGLSHSSSHPSIMQPYYSGPVGDENTYKLPMDDLQAIQTLYGVKVKRETTPPVGRPTPRRPERPKTPPPRVTAPPDPDAQARCEGGFDAVANIRGEVFFFKGSYFWRMQRTGSLVSFSPARITNFWMGLPHDTNKIDAVYERKTDNHIIFFIGSNYWIFKDTSVLPGYPRPLSEWRMRTQSGKQVDQVQSAFVWAHNGKTYLFSRGEFWRFTEGQGGTVPQPDAEYPKSVSLWKGVPSDPDDVISWGQEGYTYFFKGNSYWALKSGGLDEGVITPKSTAVDWMRCPAPAPTPSYKPRSGGGQCNCDVNTAPTFTAPSRLILVPLVILLQCVGQLI
ncbi:matrix metalloproteinase-25 isoform X1 [Pygocentrus nattereri]|uniref:Peptidase metallopeptidase domain-containing protein n=1 Tax=Pygocentrus nattereri TaxID=42514 RepID=A0A3B4EEJ6_PYGNA|nr:matrix metalloproteinase-25 isoform X1 [Pygocentrus nattereri]